MITHHQMVVGLVSSGVTFGLFLVLAGVVLYHLYKSWKNWPCS